MRTQVEAFRWRRGASSMLAALGCVSALGLAAPGAAVAAPEPLVIPIQQQLAFSINKTEAMTEAGVFGNGETLNYRVEYGLASSEWCKQRGLNPFSPEHATPLIEISGAVPFAEEKVAIGPLSTGAEYCVDAVAGDNSGVGRSEFMTFRAGAPTPVASEVLSTSPSAANLSGSINPANQTTAYRVAYSGAGSEWCTSKGAKGTPESTKPRALAAGSAFAPITEGFGGLTGGDEYCAAITAENESGAAASSQVKFVAGAPAVAPFALEAVAPGTTTATFPGSVDPAGQPTQYWVEYGPAGSEWCESGGRVGSPEHATPTLTSAPAGEYLSLAVEVTGLSPATEYCGWLAARNSDGSAHGAQEFFLTNAALTVALAGTGSGRVSGPGISCPGTCSSGYAAGTRVALTAIPLAGSKFSGWSGACTGTGACRLTMRANKDVTATFTASSPSPSPPPPANPPLQKHRPVVNPKTGEIEVEYEFPEPGLAEAFGEVSQGATLASLRVRAGVDAKAKRCRSGRVRRGRRCVSNTPVRYGQSKLVVGSAGTYKLHVKPSGKVLSALRAGRTLTVRVVVVFTPAGTTEPISESSMIKLHMKRRKGGRGAGHVR